MERPFSPAQGWNAQAHINKRKAKGVLSLSATLFPFLDLLFSLSLLGEQPPDRSFGQSVVFDDFSLRFGARPFSFDEWR